jgi:hypothetical protein
LGSVPNTKSGAENRASQRASSFTLLAPRDSCPPRNSYRAGNGFTIAVKQRAYAVG